ncbi:MAG: hypothetical protein OEW09_10860, partial [Anaerolineae bacterium]|nr:hypothetical protein [Anaerolineae bacterium]
MEDTSKVHLESLKRYVMVSIAVALAFLGGFYFFVMKVSLVQCVLGWLFGLSVCFVILHVSFRYIFRMQDRTTRYLNQMRILTEVGKELASLVDLPQLLQAILDSAVAIISTA